MATNKKERIFYWDNLKGFLILLVIAGHYIEYLMKQYPSLEYFWTAIYSFHMPAFILVTGYFLGKSHKNPLDKIPKIAGLYLLMELLYMLCSLFRHEPVRLEIGTPQYACWFLLFLVYSYVLTYFLNKEHDILIFTASIIFSLLSGFDESIGISWAIRRSVYFMPYLIIGTTMSKHINLIIEKLTKKKILCLFGFSTVQFLLFLAQNKNWFERKFFRGAETYAQLSVQPYLGIYLRCCSYIISAILVVCLLGLIPKRKTLLAIIGKDTFIIYLVHSFVLKNLYPVFERFECLNIFSSLMIISIVIITICLILIKLKYNMQDIILANLHNKIQ